MSVSGFDYENLCHKDFIKVFHKDYKTIQLCSPNVVPLEIIKITRLIFYLLK